MKKQYSTKIHKMIGIVSVVLAIVSCTNSGDSRIAFINGDVATVSVEENVLETGYVALTNVRLLRETVFSLTGGADQANFSIDQVSGELSFNVPKDFEIPADSDANNIYVIEITVTDNVETITQVVTVTVTDKFDLNLISTDVKTIQFAWTELPEATFYRLLVSPDGVSGFTIEQDNIVGFSQEITVPAHLTDWANVSYVLEAHNSTGLLNSTNAIFVDQAMLQVIGYFKASNTGTSDLFGSAVSLSVDGTTLAVGAIGEASNATGINSSQTDNTKSESGAVYVFTRNGTSWSQQAYIKAFNTDAGDQFGIAVSLSADGNTLAVGAPSESSNTNGINTSNGLNNSGGASGATYVFTRSGVDWSQQAYIKASNFAFTLGGSVSLSDNGTTLAVGAENGLSLVTGINQPQGVLSPFNAGAGAVYVFTFDGFSWSEQAYIKASNTDQGDRFGNAVSLNVDGSRLAVGAPFEESDAVGINLDQADNTAPGAGAVYLFHRIVNTWTQEAYIKASNTNAGDFFGDSVSFNSEGDILAVGATFEDSDETGVNPNQLDNSFSGAGAVYVFVRTGLADWNQQAYIKASNTNTADGFGRSVSLSNSGSLLVVGAAEEDSNAVGVNVPGQEDNSKIQSGAVYVYSLSGNNWSQKAYVKALNTDFVDTFGTSISLSGDGGTLAVGAIGEDSIATGVNAADSIQEDNSTLGAGAVYLY